MLSLIFAEAKLHSAILKASFHCVRLHLLCIWIDSPKGDAIYKFKRYEDSSLTYTGINRHEEDGKVGLWSTTISREELYSE